MPKHLEFEKKVTAIAMLTEGNSIRGIERMTGVHRDTIMRLGVRVGQGCREIMEQEFHDLDCKLIEVDELWGFIGEKKKTVKSKFFKPRYNSNAGDVWTWVAIDAKTKLVPTFTVGDRGQYHANVFMDDLASRVNGRPQISSDALPAYGSAIERAFGAEVDYGTVIKTFADKSIDDERRYSPPKVTSVRKEARAGNPDMEFCSTSYVEKQNHTVRMHCRRLSRLTNAFSKKLENFEAAIGLHYAYYNFCKRHITIRCTPAMEAGVTDSFWTVADLVARSGES